MTEQPSRTKALNTSKRLYSLATIINISLVTLIGAIAVLALITLLKLKSFEETLTSITSESLPSVINAGQLYAQMNLLLSVTEQLSMANSEAMRRIALKAIDQQFSGSDYTGVMPQNGNYVLVQVASIKRELDELNSLVIQKIEVNNDILRQQMHLYALFDEIQTLPVLLSSAPEHPHWQMDFANAVILAGELLTLDQLSLIRQQQQRLSRQIVAMSALTKNNPVAKKENIHAKIQRFEEIVLAPDKGLVALRQSQLKILGRVQGRSNLVRNLITDYARLNEFESHQLNEAVLARAADTTLLVKRQIKQVSSIFFVVLLAYIGFAVFIHRFVVRRLKTLRNQVLQRAGDHNQVITVSGNDEITELAKSFEQFAHTIELQKETLEEMSMNDALTGIANRRAFDERYHQALSMASRQRTPLAILLLDVDYFKQYNDNYGHSEGDRCLKQVADLLKSQLPRKTDVIARYGGEEFAILLPDTSQNGAEFVAEQILDAFKNAQIPHDYSGVADHVTISIGLTRSQEINGMLIPPSIEEADEALYLAKRRGRNCWVKYAPPLPQ
ncbi:sensor domain-containing diguanylate cyclase [Alteromonas gilva]|uniref:diguanylate cyclase n=1 Tax=Alteromonas gilva TaxID=2987522 RepID=A0ABT5L0R4_9ALTE|nr:sensor domain-containing diguanylate cyclase [Alteromonas gilva]MDC8830019.1 sensor domain-containing diguanylate cyclase [Alteromonas gilva]